jgi:hypothetical protein
VTSRRIVAAGLIAMLAAGCTLMAPERVRRRFDCNGVSVTVSTRQRVPDWFGGEEYVYATTAGQDGIRIRAELDNNGRWTDQLGASVAEDGSWARFHVMDSRGPAAGRYRYFSVAFVEIRTGTVIRSAYAHSTEEERAAGWFTSSAMLPTEQTIRGNQVMWRPCTDA